MWNSIRNVVVSRSRSLDDNDVQPKYSQTRTSSERGLAELEQDCRRIDVSSMFQGLQQNVSNLWSLIDMQKKRIQSLESQLSCLRELARSYKACETLPQPLKEYTVTMRMLGAVMGHEQQVLKYLQQHLLKDHVKLVNANSGEHAAVTLQFHRMKQRLPADELAAVLAASAGVPSKLVVVFMHNLPNGHEKHMRHAGLNNTDPGCWQHFVQQCHKVVNMTFDEGRWQWHNINSAAAQAIIDVVKETVASSENRTKPGPIVHLKGILQD
ncbi:hypothetical protein ABBQ38_000552 [Trebouxia sp. C0009 RCD-2024]